MRSLRPTAGFIVGLLVLLGTTSTSSAQTFGFSTEPLVPIGKFASAADVGWGMTGYFSTRLGGRKSPWVFTADVGAQWHAGDTIDEEEFPNFVLPDTVGDEDAIDFSTWLFPIRGSLTRLIGRTYVSPRVGVYIPVGDLKNRLGFEPSLGFSPKIGYLFFVTRDVTADVGVEYTIIFGEETLMYVGFNFGFLLGGKRLPRRPIPY